MFHFTGIIQKPHDHLFQKQGLLGSTCAAKAGKPKFAKFGFIFSGTPKYVSSWVICGNCTSYICFILMESHRSLVTINFRSCGIWVRQVPRRLENKKREVRGYSLMLYPNILPVGTYVVICSYYMDVLIMVRHRGPMTMYFRSRETMIQHVSRKLENQKMPNSGFSLVAYPNIF